MIASRRVNSCLSLVKIQRRGFPHRCRVRHWRLAAVGVPIPEWTNGELHGDKFSSKTFWPKGNYLESSAVQIGRQFWGVPSRNKTNYRIITTILDSHHFWQVDDFIWRISNKISRTRKMPNFMMGKWGHEMDEYLTEDPRKGVHQLVSKNS